MPETNPRPFSNDLNEIAQQLLELTDSENTKESMRVAGKYQDIDVAHALEIPHQIREIHHTVRRFLDGAVGFGPKDTAHKLNNLRLELYKLAIEVTNSHDLQKISDALASNTESISDLKLLGGAIDRMNHIVAGCWSFSKVANAAQGERDLD